jgi:VanZ family protein
MGAIFYFSAQPAGADLAWWEVAIRKLGHFGGYALLTLLWSWALSPALGRRAIPIAAAIAVLYAASDEYHQSLVDGRHGTIRDVAIDALGAVSAAFALRWWLDRRRLDPALLGRHQHGLRPVERA